MPAVAMWTLLVISAPLVLSQHAEEAAEASPPPCGGYYGECNASTQQPGKIFTPNQNVYIVGASFRSQFV